jgi:hypothetical protein
MQKEMESMAAEKIHLEKQLAEIKGEKEKELDTAKLGMAISKEQLEVDKATLIEKAEEDQRRTEAEIQQLKSRLDDSERELQALVLSKENEKSNAEESFRKEEAALKEAVRIESEKRDYEQKLYEQEKNIKEKEVARLKEEYEKKKWQWDNQIRTLLMQKSVQDAEHEAERMRVDREARTALRGMEAQRDEIKQRLNELRARHENLVAGSKKEMELIQQRWRWRKDRLWSMWQSRLDVLKKERLALAAQIEQIQSAFKSEQDRLADAQQGDTGRIGELTIAVAQSAERGKGLQRQKQIQLELEKTRLAAQIKECEALMTEWMDRLRRTQDEVSRNNGDLAAQLNYLDRWSRDEEKETELFLRTIQNALSVLETALGPLISERAA